MAKKVGTKKRISTRAGTRSGMGMRKEGATKGTDSRSRRKGETVRKGSDTDRMSTDRSSVERGSTPKEGRAGGKTRAPGMGMTLFNRNIFNDPFFTAPWEDMFNFPSIDDMIHKAKDMTKSAMRAADKMSKDVDTTHPGSYSSKSFYRTMTSGPGQEPHREVISQETVTNVDDKGRKFTEKWKNLERDNVKKTTHLKMIGDKGVKEMRTQNSRTGEEYEHIDYHLMNEKDIHNFNSDFDRGIRKVRTMLPTTGGMGGGFMGSMLPDIDRFGMGMPGITPGYFPSFGYERLGLPSGDFGWGGPSSRGADWGTSSRGGDWGSSQPQTESSERKGGSSSDTTGRRGSVTSTTGGRR